MPSSKSPTTLRVSAGRLPSASGGPGAGAAAPRPFLLDGDYGDIVATGGGTHLAVENDAISNAKLANMAANTIKVRDAGTSGDPADLTVGTNTVLGRVGGNIVAAALVGSQVAANAIGDANLRASVGLSLIGRAGNTTGDPADVQASGAYQVPRINAAGSALSWEAVRVSQGGVISLAYTYSTSTDVNNVASGEVRFSGTLSASGITCAINSNEAAGGNIASLRPDLHNGPEGLLTLRHAFDPSRWLIRRYAGPVSSAGGSHRIHFAGTDPFLASTGDPTTVFSAGDPVVVSVAPLVRATGVRYAPAEPSNWPDPDPTTVAGALDKLVVNPATNVPYTPATANQWLDPDPTTVAGALDALAVRVDASRFTVSEIEDDFAYVGTRASTPIFWGDSGAWNTTAADASVVWDSVVVDEQHSGVLAFSGSPEAAFYKLGNSRSIQTLDRMVCLVRLDTLGSVLGFEFGLSGGTAAAVNTTGVNAFTIVWNQTSTWKYRTGNTGGNTLLDSGIAAVHNAWTRLEMFRTTSGLFFSINGSPAAQGVATLPNQATLVTPIVRTRPGFGTIAIDAVHWRFLTPGRA